ncbi:MAG: hypothetical protein ACE5DX_05050 [Candidatus Dojkabacteria bacterium]
MGNKTARIILNLVLVIVLLVSLLGILVIGFTGAWLHTYRVFTEKTKVAEVEVIPREENVFEVKYRQVKNPTGLSAVFGASTPGEEFESEQSFEFKGDEIRIGGQVVKFNDPLSLLGFKTVYKITRIESAFLDVETEIEEGRDLYELNGGVDETFKFLQRNEANLSAIIDTAMGDYPGKNVQSEMIVYGLFVTEEGFLLDRL